MRGATVEDDFVDRSGAPSAFENDGYDEPDATNDEALTFQCARGGGDGSAALVARATRTTAREGDAPYNTHLSVSADGAMCAVTTTSGRVRIIARDGGSGALGDDAREFVPGHGCAVNECEFGSASDPHAIVLACGDGTVRVYDVRTKDDRATGVFRAPYGERDVPSASLGGDGDTLVAAAAGAHVVFYDRRTQGGDACVGLFQDAHSEVVTRVRFHPERRSELYTSSVDSLVCAFDCSRAPLNDEDALITIMSADAAVNNIGFCRTGASGNERDAVWCTTGIEEAHIFLTTSSDKRRVGVQLVHLKNARALAQTAAHSQSFMDFSTQVDYVLGIHDGVDPGELYLSAGTQSGSVGVFPLVQGPEPARGTAGYVILGPPVAVLRNGHRDIVRAMSWDGNRHASEAARVPLTCGEDSLVCAWTPGAANAADPPSVDRTRPLGRRHSPY